VFRHRRTPGIDGRPRSRAGSPERHGRSASAPSADTLHAVTPWIRSLEAVHDHALCTAIATDSLESPGASTWSTVGGPAVRAQR
jgi:hypothetical protein